MNPWGVAPLLAAALIGGSTATHSASIQSHGPAARQDASQVRLHPGTIVVARPAVGQAAAEWSFATMTAVLNQTATGSWQAAVLVYTGGGQCPIQSAFWLETNSPLSPFPASDVTGGKAQAPAGNTAGPAANICNVTVTFPDLGSIPATAALVLDEQGAPSPLQLSISRNVPLCWYLGIPALAGVFMVLLLFALCVMRIHVPSEDDNKIRPWNSKYWSYRIFASGAWTLNDSWATNITSLVAVVGIILTVTSAANSLFPGVALDRFAIVNACAGAIAAAAPLVFGVLYAAWTHSNPGITADATVALPARAAGRLTRWNATLPRGIACDARLPRNTQVVTSVSNIPIPIRLPANTPVHLGEGTDITLTDCDPIRLADASNAALSAGTTTNLPANTIVRVNNGPLQRWGQQIPIQLAGAANTTLAQGTRIVPSSCRWTRISAGAQVTLQRGTKVILPDGRTGQVANHTGVELPAGATAMFAQPPRVTLAGRRVTLAAQTQGALAARVRSWRQGAMIRIPVEVTAVLGANATATLADVRYEPVAAITLSAGAGITVAGGAAVGTADNVDRWPVQVIAAKTIQVPLGTRIDVLGGGVMALPGSADVLVKGESGFNITNANGADDGLGDGGREVTIAGSDTGSAAQDPPAANEKAPQGDVILKMPSFMTAPAGAKITVAGLGDLILPKQATVTAPRRKDFTLHRDRHVQMPQAGNLLVANMRLAVISALVTIFGVGAEIGIIGVLAFQLSDASSLGRIAGLFLTIFVAVFALWYSHTAVRALADPQPGS